MPLSRHRLTIIVLAVVAGASSALFLIRADASSVRAPVDAAGADGWSWADGQPGFAFDVVRVTAAQPPHRDSTVYDRARSVRWGTFSFTFTGTGDARLDITRGDGRRSTLPVRFGKFGTRLLIAGP